jgi:hypothetical protein
VDFGREKLVEGDGMLGSIPMAFCSYAGVTTSRLTALKKAVVL